MICIICKEEINKKNERYVKLTDYDCGTKTGEVYYHLQCWKTRFQITNDERKKRMMKGVMQSVGKMSKNLQILK